MPSFHALGPCTEYSRHRVLKSVEAHRSTSMPLQSRCCHQRLSICVINVVTCSQYVKCQQTSLAGSHSRGTRKLHSGAGNSLFAYPRQAWCRFVANPTTITSPPYVRSCTPYRLDARSTPGKPSKDTTHSHRPEGLSSRTTSPPPVASGVHHRNASPLVLHTLWQAKARQA